MSVLRFSDVFDEDTWATQCAELKELNVTGICIYTDGGYRPKLKPPFTSWALHSFFYKEGKPTKTARYKFNFPTKEGYVDTIADKSSIVTAYKIFNASGLIRTGHVTNNVAELQAFILALDLVIKTGLKDILKTIRVFSDSEYVLNNAIQHLKTWKERGWKLSSGQPVQNLDYWKVIDLQLKEIEDLDIDTAFEYVKGHVNAGNIIVDAACTLAITTGIEVNNFCDEEWYHSKEVEIEPLLLEQRYLHFPGLTEGYDDYIYMFSFLDTKIPISSIGCRLEDISIAIIKTQDVDTLDNLKLVHRECVKLEELIAPVPMVVDLKNILNNKFNYFLLNDLTKQLPRIEEIDKVTINNPIDESTVLQVISPPRNSFKALDEYQKGVKILRDLFNDEPSVRKTDITDYFYKTVEKKNALEFILKTEEAVEVDVEYWAEDIVKTTKIILTVGLDLPRRRVLYNLVNTNPKISVITWEWGQSSFRCGVLVETDNSYGFWFTPYANTQLLEGE